MAKHQKTIILAGINAYLGETVRRPAALRPARGTKYFTTCSFITSIRGALDTVKSGQKRRARIVVRPSRHHLGLHELYTYHFPTHWSDACQANRELIKLAQRQAHDIESDHSSASLEWRTRFLAQLINPEPDKKQYPHFYSFVYTTIYSALRAAYQASQGVTFEPVSTDKKCVHSCVCRKKVVPLHPNLTKNTCLYEKNLSYPSVFGALAWVDGEGTSVFHVAGNAQRAPLPARTAANRRNALRLRHGAVPVGQTDASDAQRRESASGCRV